jgi:L-2,4-diaminobutyrate decarboxylase
MNSAKPFQLHEAKVHLREKLHGIADFQKAFDTYDFLDATAIASGKLAEILGSDKVEGVFLEDPIRLIDEARGLMAKPGETGFNSDRFARILDLFIRTTIKVNSRGYMARQFSSAVPAAAVLEMVTALAPQPASYYEAGQLANVADHIMAEEFAPLIGWEPERFALVTTSGASLANMTAVLAARNAKLESSWEDGMGVNGRGRGRPAVAIGADAHFSVSRIAGILGLGQKQVIALPLDERRRIDIAAAKAALDDAAANGLDVFCVIGVAGSTAVGAIDPLDELAELARARDAWFHVDAAHNGAFLVSDRLRPRLKGIEKADSFCLDAHKTLFMPGVCTLLFYRDAAVADTAFPHKASYVFDAEEDEMSRFESGTKNFECTKRPSILNLWLTWALYGRGLFEQKLDHLIDLTQTAHDLIAQQPDFRVVHPPESNILCFEHTPGWVDEAELGALQLDLRNRIRAEGRRFISKVELNGRTVLRMVLMNHRIGEADILDLLNTIRRQARDRRDGRPVERHTHDGDAEPAIAGPW